MLARDRAEHSYPPSYTGIRGARPARRARRDEGIMTRTPRIAGNALLVLIVLLLAPTPAHAVVIGLTDTFSTGLGNWTTSLGPGGGVPPVPPTRVTGGGPGGAGDPFMQVSAVGGCDRPGCRLV